VLDLDTGLGGEEPQRTVYVRAKLDTVFADLAKLGETPDLKSSRIGQDRPVPAHEAVKAAELAHDVVPRPQKEVRGVCEQALSVGCDQVRWRQALHTSLGRNRHEGRRVDRAVSRPHAAGPRRTVGPQELEAERAHTISIASPYE